MNTVDKTFIVRKENVVMTCMTSEALGKRPFIVYSNKGGSLFVSVRFSFEQGVYTCRYDSTRRLCDNADELRKLKVEDIERKALLAGQGTEWES